MGRKYLSFILCLSIITAGCAKKSITGSTGKVDVNELNREVSVFLEKEISFYAQEVIRQNYAPDSIAGYPIASSSKYNYLTNLFSTAADYGLQKNSKNINFEEVTLKLLDSCDYSTVTFPQLYYLRTLNNLKDLGKNDISSFTAVSNDELKRGLDPANFIDTTTWLDNYGRPINYVGVALMIAAEGTQYGFDYSEIADSLFASCIRILKSTEGFMDDSKTGAGKFDRYSHEFARFVYLSADMMGREDVKKEVKPFFVNSFKLWWDLFNPATGHSSHWGRSLQNSWDDTWENTSFLMKYPELSPATHEQLVMAFKLAFDYWTRNEYNHKLHVNLMLDSCRGTYSYAQSSRIWEYTAGSLAKLAESAKIIFDEYKGSAIISEADFYHINRFDYFRYAESKAGVWVFKTDSVYFALPLVSSDNNDYLPIPYGSQFLETPVGKNYPILTPELTAENGDVYTLAGQPDSVYFNPAQTMLTAYWSQIKTKKKYARAAVSAVWHYSAGQLHAEYHLKVSENMDFRTITTMFSSNRAGVRPQVSFNKLPVKGITEKPDAVSCKGAFRPIEEITSYSYDCTQSEGDITMQWSLKLK